MATYMRVTHIGITEVVFILLTASTLFILQKYSVTESGMSSPVSVATSSLEENHDAVEIVAENIVSAQPSSSDEDIPCTERDVSPILLDIEKQFFARTTVWERTAYYVAPAQEADPYGWMSTMDGSGSAPILPCESVMVLTARKQPSFVSEDDGIYDWLKQNGWRDEMLQEIKIDSTGHSIGVALGHAGGPTGMSTMFTRPLYNNRAVEFFAITTQSTNENFAAYRDDIAPDPCPCGMTVTLRHSFPVSFVPYLE